MAFVNRTKPASVRPLSQHSKAMDSGQTAFGRFMSVLENGMIRDNFNTSTWLCLGACLQSILLLSLPSRFYALLPAFAILAFRIGDVLLMTFGLKRNQYMNGVIAGKFSAQIPDTNGKFSANPADSQVCVMILGVRSNHPLGMFGPGYKEIADYFKNMVKELEANPEEYGFLGMSSWLNFGDRAASNEIMTVSYYRSAAHLHHFARGPSHRAGWDWWNKMVKEHPYLGIMHEVYAVPKQGWESVYINYHPTGLGKFGNTLEMLHRQEAESRANADTFAVAATTHIAKGTEGNNTWVSPIVDSRKGRFRSSAGRMGRGLGDENETVAEDPYAQ
ncbi:MAG: hypothetical protein M1830_000492 [Pleopsidium flavum]|nr:MAG: hypothetical protein M1830_002871 [Pleopsidium flavum]KAI9878581.1 MAG: hypothetical protein M1830_000492 [Pleopsidium flavum]